VTHTVLTCDRCRPDGYLSTSGQLQGRGRLDDVSDAEARELFGWHVEPYDKHVCEECLAEEEEGP